MLSDIAETTGKKFTKVLADTLWYIDSHHDVFLQSNLVLSLAFINTSLTIICLKCQSTIKDHIPIWMKGQYQD